MKDYKEASALIWFQYMYNMLKITVERNALELGMSYEIIDALGIDHKVIHKCVETSFDTKDDYQSDNRFLREDKKWAQIMNIHQHPVITINNQTFQGEMTGPDIAKAICASFSTRPPYC